MKRISWLAAAALLALTAPLAGLDPRLATVNDWLYVLQLDAGVTIGSIAATEFDLAVIDYSVDGSEAGEHTAEQIALLKASGKVALAYMSIGEAEVGRFYWDPAWIDQAPDDPDAPPWLGPFNPDFPDNYKVRYWDPDWQAIIFGVPTGVDRSYLDRIVDQGFDGVYLDIIDAFYYWSEVVGERTREEARLDMIAFVEGLAAYARETRGVADFLVFPQNGGDIVLDDDDLLDAAGESYLTAIDGIGVEDVFYDELSPQPSADVDYRTGVLAEYLGSDRLVISVDYVWDEADPAGAGNVARYNDYQALALDEGYVAHAAVSDRELDEIVTVEDSGGFLTPQPKPDGTIFADGFESGDLSAWSAVP